MSDLLIEQVTKSYKNKYALNQLNLTINQGMFGLLGPNGAGKTTLMRILSTLTKPDEGIITYQGMNWLKNSSEVRKIIGYLPQKFSLYKHIKVKEAILHLATLKGIDKKVRESVVDEVLYKVNLQEQSEKKIGQLSGGMVRRVGIAQAILGNPKILIVDEPTAGLDPEERIRFRKLLRQLGNDSIVIISTHIVEDIEVSCDNLAIMNNGNIINQGTIKEITEMANGNVWEIILSKDEFYKQVDHYEMISSENIDEGYKVRLITGHPPKQAKQVSPTLEEAYFYLMRRDHYEK